MEPVQKDYIHFSIGPVQDFIAAARTVRDLWSGSYMLSWLTARAMAEALKGEADLLGSGFDENCLVLFHQDGRKPADVPPEKRGQFLQSCLPNTFIARVAAGEGAKLAEAMKSAVRGEWEAIADAVHEALDGKWKSGWDTYWDEQVEAFWDVRTAVLPADWRSDKLPSWFEVPENNDKAAVEMVGRLAAAQKLIRHFPPAAPDDDTREKCVLTGADAQMGPIGDRRFWEKACSDASGLGERLQPKDRFCAVSLVKRFAWACYFKDQLGVDFRAKRSADTATIAAANWIVELSKESVEGLPNDKYLHEHVYDENKHWSGQWLNWKSRDPYEHLDSSRDDDPMPEWVWKLIGNSKNAMRKASKWDPEKPAAPPTYYAVLAMDGDHMGKILQECDRTGSKLEQSAKISQALQRFALENVPEIIAEYLGGDHGIKLGQPVYAGGDDVLALLPVYMNRDGGAESVLRCAKRMRDSFAGLMDDLKPAGVEEPTMSAGIAIVHYKTDLREALGAARAAEKAAKDGGRNQLVLAAVRRSGEYTQAMMHWDQVEEVDQLLNLFRKNELSDRWTYQLRQEMEEALTEPDMVDCEFARLLARTEKNPPPFIDALFKNVKKHYLSRNSSERGSESNGRDGGEPKPDPLKPEHNALTIIQTASFMARARED